MDIHTSLSPELTSLWQDATEHSTHHFPFQTLTWMRAWQEAFAPNGHLMIVSDAEKKVIAPFGIHESTATLMGAPELTDHEDSIGSDASITSCWPDIIETLKTNAVTSLHLTNIWANSPTLTFFKEYPHATVTQSETTPYMDLPGTWEAYVESLPKKERHELERKLRKFEREHPTVAISTSETTLDALITLMKLDPRKAAFFTAPVEQFFRMIPTITPDTTQIMMLTVDGSQAAGVIGFICDDTYYLYNSGFDEMNFKGAGFYLKAMNIKWAIENGIKKYNFLRGNERYKYELGGKDFGVYTITVAL
jgi:CelD/BcsL family acetyltransferase involved in cellulose biosynthesis